MSCGARTALVQRLWREATRGVTAAASASSCCSYSCASLRHDDGAQLASSLHCASLYQAECAAAAAAARTAVTRVRVQPCCDASARTSRRTARTLADVAADDIYSGSRARDDDDDDNNNNSTAALSSSLRSRRDSAACRSLRAHAQLRSLLQQWVCYTAWRVSRDVFVQQQQRIAAVLLPPPPSSSASSHAQLTVLLPDAGVLPLSSSYAHTYAAALTRSLLRHAAVCYAQLLAHHRCRSCHVPRQQLQLLCDRLCATSAADGSSHCDNTQQSSASGVRVVCAPLLPSGCCTTHARNSSSSSNRHNTSDAHALRLLASLLQWRELLLLLTCATALAKATATATHTSTATAAALHHVSSRDLGEVLQRHAHECNGSVSDDDDDDDVRRLRRWHRGAFAAECADVTLAAACRVDRTAARKDDNNDDDNNNDDEEDGSSGDNNTRGVYSKLAQLLQRGRWRATLLRVCAVARTYTTHRPHKTRLPVTAHGDALRWLRACAAALQPLYGRAHGPLRVRGKCVVHHRHVHGALRLPRALVVTPATAEETALLQSPPLRGLRVVRAHRQPEHEPQQAQGAATRRTARAVGADDDEEHSSVHSSASHASVIELRRRLRVLAALPPHTPLSLVCFECAAQRRGRRGRRGRGTVGRLLPYIWRQPAVELLPTLLVTAAAAAMEVAVAEAHTRAHTTAAATATADGAWRAALQPLRDVLTPTLFALHPSYASLSEFAAQLLVHLGRTAADAVVVQQQQQQHRYPDTGNNNNACDSDALFCDVVTQLLQPPSLEAHYDVRQHSASRHADMERWARVVWREAMMRSHDSNTAATASAADKDGVEHATTTTTAAASSPCVYKALCCMGLCSLQHDDDNSSSRATKTKATCVLSSATATRFLRDKLCSARNYHATVCVAATAHAASSLAPLLRLLHSETSAYGAMVLSVEAAAAVVTACALHALACARTPHGDAADANNNNNTNRCSRRDEVHRAVTALTRRLRSSCGGVMYVAYRDDEEAHTHHNNNNNKRSNSNKEHDTRVARTLQALRAQLGGLYHDAYVAAVLQHSNDDTHTTTTNNNNNNNSNNSNAATAAHVLWSCDVDVHSAAALLVTHALRPSQRQPFSCADVFCRLSPCARATATDDNSSDSHNNTTKSNRPHTPEHRWRCGRAPASLRVHMARIDLVALVSYFAYHYHNSNANSSSHDHNNNGVAVTDAPRLLAASLPYGLHAVYKPPHMCTTLHATLPSLPSFLLRCLPWQTTTTTHDTTTTTTTSAAEAVVPLQHQHGLVNRLDAGTSGITLVTRNACALRCARHAAMVQHSIRKRYYALVQQTHSTAPSSSWSSCADVPVVWHLPPRGVVAHRVSMTGSSYALSARLHTHGEEHDDDDDETMYGQQQQQQHRRQQQSSRILRTALTHFRVCESFARHGIALLEVSLTSGCRHQIRQHMAAVSHPLLGDARYNVRCARAVAAVLPSRNNSNNSKDRRRHREDDDIAAANDNNNNNDAADSDDGSNSDTLPPPLQQRIAAAIASVSLGLTRPALHAHAVDVVTLPHSATAPRQQDGDDADEEQQHEKQQQEQSSAALCAASRRVVVQCALPPDMQRVLQWLREDAARA